MPPGLQSWVEIRLAEGRYADAAEYVRDLVRRDQERCDQAEGTEEEIAEIRALVEEGIASGIVDAEPEDVLNEIIAAIPSRRA